MTSNCHTDYRHAPFLHAPMKATNSCELCHKVKAASPKHPVLLPLDKKAVNATCLTCHESFMPGLHKKFSHLHGAIEKQGCLSCHDPHKGVDRALTRKMPRFDLCLDCHKDQHKASQLSHHRVKDFEKGCLACHTTHGANNDKLLLSQDQTQFCMNCHSKAQGETQALVLTGARSIHAPVKKGECSKCHAPHGSNEKNLLVKKYLPAHIGKYKKEDSALCFECHKKDLVNNQYTQTATKFRNGAKNLHFLHIVGQKRAKSCGICHETHASGDDFLLRGQFEYKGITLPMRFMKTDSGGNCTTACHKQSGYSRTGEVVP